MNISDWVQATERKLDALPKRNTEHLRTIVHWLLSSLGDQSAEFVVGVALALLAKDQSLIASELVQGHAEALQCLDAPKLEAFGANMESWHAVDIFAVCLAGPSWREGQISDQDIARWAAHESPWWRRAALVTTTGLNVRSRGGYGDSDRTLAVARLLTRDREDTVVKALSWALRELVYWEPDRVAAFLDEHGQALAARVRREVGNKLNTGRKAPRLG